MTGGIQSDKNTLLKRIWEFIWGDSPLPQLLNINAKLSPFGKIVNVTWFVFFIISFGTSLLFRVSVSVSMYFIVTLPVLILSLCCIIILFRKEFGLQRYICLSLTALNMLLSQEWVDLPSYIKQDYKVVEGVPSVFEFHQPRSGSRYWEIVVDGVEFYMPENINERFSDRWFVVRYLPHSKFILDYKILTEEETRKKLQMLK
jgi:hypothetical protein